MSLVLMMDAKVPGAVLRTINGGVTYLVRVLG
jgi:hypothetical protein